MVLKTLEVMTSFEALEETLSLKRLLQEPPLKEHLYNHHAVELDHFISVTCIMN